VTYESSNDGALIAEITRLVCRHFKAFCFYNIHDGPVADSLVYNPEICDMIFQHIKETVLKYILSDIKGTNGLIWIFS
jgi:hypothetical protein